MNNVQINVWKVSCYDCYDLCAMLPPMMRPWKQFYDAQNRHFPGEIYSEHLDKIHCMELVVNRTQGLKSPLQTTVVKCPRVSQQGNMFKIPFVSINFARCAIKHVYSLPNSPFLQPGVVNSIPYWLSSHICKKYQALKRHV